jgi:hypothetical protein
MGLDTGRVGAKRYPVISVVRSGSDGEDQHREGLIVVGGAAPSRGGEVVGVRASVCYGGSGVTGVGQTKEEDSANSLVGLWPRDWG